MSVSIRFDAIEDAIADIKNGKIIIVVDDENRENEGDFVAAAECVTPEMINFMAQHGRGLICTPITESYCSKLDLYPMVHKNTDPMRTAFTVSVDLKGNGVTSGISASDRSKTVKHLIYDQANQMILFVQVMCFLSLPKKVECYDEQATQKQRLTLHALLVSSQQE